MLGGHRGVNHGSPYLLECTYCYEVLGDRVLHLVFTTFESVILPLFSTTNWKQSQPVLPAVYVFVISVVKTLGEGVASQILTIICTGTLFSGPNVVSEFIGFTFFGTTLEDAPSNSKENLRASAQEADICILVEDLQPNVDRLACN